MRFAAELSIPFTVRIRAAPLIALALEEDRVVAFS
jgi:hypothetical protein